MKNSQENRPIGIWIRVSTEDQAKGESPEHHLERAKAYAAAKGWTVREVYNLAGQSGKAVMAHPEARRMMADVERGHISALVFSKLARLSRNLREVQDFGDYFRKYNADLISLNESIDTTTAGGRMFFHLLGVFAQWEREEIAERIAASVAVRAKLGKPLSGQSPYGYVWQDKKKLVPEPAEAAIRKRAYELFLEHRRKGVVARLLNEAGYRTRSKAQWSDMAVGRILRCSSAKGVHFINRIRQLGNWKYEEKPQNEWVRLELEPIVTEELWLQCNRILEEQEKKFKRRGKRPATTFGGLTFCACGHPMYVRSHSPKYVCEKCYHKIPIVDLEAIFHEEMKVYFTQPERLAEHLRVAEETLRSKEALLAAHEKEIQKVQEEMTRTHRLYLEGAVTAQGFGQFYKPAEERLNQLSAELPRLQAELDHLKIRSLSADDILTEATQLYERWPQLGPDEKRKVAESLVERIVVGPDEIHITLSCLPSSEEMTNSQQGLTWLGAESVELDSNSAVAVVLQRGRTWLGAERAGRAGASHPAAGPSTGPHLVGCGKSPRSNALSAG